MTATRDRLHSARRYLEVFEESWTADHVAAMRCRDFEESLAEAVKVFELVDELIRLRRECVFRGLEAPNPQRDEDEKALYTSWLALVRQDMLQIEALEKTYCTVEGKDQFRACLERASTFLAKWTPAVPATAVGSRAVEFSEDDADQIRELVTPGPGAPGRPKWEPKSVPPGDPSALR